MNLNVNGMAKVAREIEREGDREGGDGERGRGRGRESMTEGEREE